MELLDEEWVNITQALEGDSPVRRSPTPAQRYADAVWESKLLKANERLVCLCYANHAYLDGKPVDRAWVTTARLMERTNLSKGAVITARNGAVQKGWLADVGHLKGHEQIRVYRLCLAKESAADAVRKPTRARNEGGRFTATGPSRVPVSAPESPRDEPVHEMDRFAHEQQVNARAEAKPVHEMNRSTRWTETGPRDGPNSLTDSLT